ncbi:hypothetical protein W97_05564 [Coniosporium apollinis CBS 100218]|uniref:Transcription factor domain-containing protein n=1 Tax=Coniosporium apollinis (strain CBS 100218) TaxID=1168221 RepID=R7YXR5_CONA1|nr:uncharacterized protein W97_05564 [Coniosporium apollinis CBS 100218]EON66466.1 hypothetical protein W97_05564 [Coniosporium apollinis CBS 100218]
MRTDLGSTSVDASLTEIDARSKEPNRENIAVGPFGVLNFNLNATFTQSQNVHTDDAGPAEELPTDTPSTLDSLMNLDDSLQWADLFELDFDNMLITQQAPFVSGAQDFFYDSYNAGYYEQKQLGDEPYTTMNRPQSAQNEVARTTSLPEPLQSLVGVPASELEPLGDIQALLKHFQDHVIAQMAALPIGSKSPWKILNLSSAVETLAEMTFLGGKNVKHAHAANLYGLLACSAYHLASNPSIASSRSVEHWEQTVVQTSRKAKEHLQKSLQAELQGPNKAKYKDQLTAILSLMAFAVISGNQKDARCCMIDAERLLRHRGLAKREISRKARLLHHIYTWVRIVGESTYVIHDYQSYGPLVNTINDRGDSRRTDTSKTHTGHNARLDDFLRLKAHQSDSDLEIEDPKDSEVGLHDIHLEDSREFSDHMYLQIYGIPETWLSLVSQTTRLANVMDAVKASSKETSMGLLESLEKRGARLENMICSFASKTLSTTSLQLTEGNNDSGQSSQFPQCMTPNDQMLRALNSALVIFFYRRIRNVNPWILQGHVDDVIQALQEFDTALLRQGLEGPGTMWPAFMAGCEAMAASKRDALMRWIEKGSSKSGLYGFKAAKEMMAELWRRRDEVNAATSSVYRKSHTPWTWVDVSRERNLWLMLC